MFNKYRRPKMTEVPIEKLVKISPLYLKRLQKVGVFSLKDLLYYFPTRYIDFSKITPISQLKPNQPATVSGIIFGIKNVRTWKKRMFITEALIQDKTGFLKVAWFNQPFIIKNLQPGDRVNVAGTLSWRDKDILFSNPAYEKLNTRTTQTRHTGRLVPVYKETRGLSSRWLRFFIQKAITKHLDKLSEFLPEKVSQQHGLLGLKTAIKQIHFPESLALAQKAKERFIFEELFCLQLFFLAQKLNLQKRKAPAIKFDQQLIKSFVGRLPFKLTVAQKKATWEIMKDMQKLNPMNRLLEGDVGSGKTVVAAMAVLQTVSAGFQAALMAPTEILAKQHYLELTKLFAGQKIKIALLTSQETKLGASKRKKKEILEKLKQGKIKIVVGTHALIQKEANFKNLALAIVDEQHRFGVKQRAALQQKISQIKDGLPKVQPHSLSMTATPIPRTLALAVYGDLELSLIDEMPKNRAGVKTFVVPPLKRPAAYNFIAKEIKAGRQVFVICPRIEIKKENKEDELVAENIDKRKLAWLEVKAVEQEYEKLKNLVFPQFKLAKFHGKLKASEKEKTMKDFRAGKTQLLVSTSVIEVGIDIPNATVMVIENADRFGLAQLHQFRGRVGRGENQSYCFLFTDSKQPETTKRLQALTTAKNGFELAEKDLALRGPGEFLGVRQSGLPDLVMASLGDAILIKKSRQAALQALKQDRELKNWPDLKKKIEQMQKNIHSE